MTLSLSWEVVALLLLNALTFALYGLDKCRARRRLRRISERTLLLLAFVGGAVGAYLGMRLFRHKTLHARFRYGVPACIILHMVCLGYLYLR